MTGYSVGPYGTSRYSGAQGVSRVIAETLVWDDEFTRTVDWGVVRERVVAWETARDRTLSTD